MDESESIYEQLTSKLSPKESINFSVFKTIVRKSKQLICLDAYLSARTLDLTESFARNDKQSLYLMSTAAQTQNPQPSQVSVTDSSCKDAIYIENAW